MIPVQRYALILERLRERTAASINELAVDIGASPSTVRRDLEHLAVQGYVQRTRGGAMMARGQMAAIEVEPDIAAQIAREKKAAIGQAAAAMLRSGQSAIFDSSSTVMEAARATIERRIALTAVTNSLTIAQVFAGAGGVRVIVPGGMVREASMTLIGEPGAAFLASLHVDVAFIGTHTISGRHLTETSLEVAAVKRAMIRAAERAVVLADGSKFQSPAFCNICAVTEIDEILTDDGADPEAVAALRALGIKITCVPAATG
ncbi:MAG: DeoR/GlpR transcriptional regulator [Burkholderiales bacterium]|nr:MAG: DeoR/GlpR transcriptional regulator [Burkholderiales bacterium]